jgi:hypothetical protein
MLGVAKALSLVMAESPANAADLLSEDFEYSTPFSGPLKKNALLSQGTLKSICPSYKQEAYDFRVDALEPARVWWTYRGSGTAEGGKSFKVGPQAASATFDTYVSKAPSVYLFAALPYTQCAPYPAPGLRLQAHHGLCNGSSCGR